MKIIIVFLLLYTSYSFAEVFKTDDLTYEATVVTSQLNAPWAVVEGPNQDLYITEKGGQIHVYKEGRRTATLSGIPSELIVFGQGGLMDLAFDPDFQKNQYVYLSYTTKENANPSDGVNTRVSRFKLVNHQLTEKKVLVQGGYGTDGAHFGCRLSFDNQGLLYATFGERHNKEKAQDLKYLNGKVIRIHSDGRIPEDNPFVNVPGARKEIYTLGHRNPQGIDIHPITGVPVISEHGPSGYDASLPTIPRVGKADEVNILKPGLNYGWPHIFGDPNILPWTEEMIQAVVNNQFVMPLREYTIPDGIAPSGVAFYTGEKIPAWTNSFFVTALRGYILRLEIDENNQVIREEKILPEGFARMRDVTTGPDGLIYAINGVGQLIKISPH